MTLNNKNCGACNNFDIVLRGIKETSWGWCSRKSEYPATEGPGQIFPLGVKRVAANEPAKPFMVKKAQVVTNCAIFVTKKVQVSKQDLVNKLLSANGKVVLR